ncbi:MAG: three-Cys-motif partner protein TcmP [Promethearchaeota archaeon]
MSKINSTIWPIESHTEAKHAILKKYLNAWLPIITRWNGRVIYIDGFAGPGEYTNGEELSDQDATERATRLLDLTKAMYTNNPKRQNSNSEV